MDVNFNQLEILYKLTNDRLEDMRLLQAIGQQVQANQRFFDLEFNQIQQSLRQMGFKIIAIKKQDKPRQEEENRILESISKISTLNLPERMYIYKFCQNVIKLYRPEMQIIRFNQKDTRDLLLMFKQFFMAENNFEAIHLVQQFMEQDFKMSIAVILIKQLITKSREDFHHMIQSASEMVIQKIKYKIAEQSKQTQHQVTEAQESSQPETPKIKIPRRSSIKRDLSVTQSKALPIFRSVSMMQQPQPPQNAEKELRMQLRMQQRQLRKKFAQISKPILDLDVDHYWCMHMILRKKFYKHPDKYFLQGGGFYLWNQLKNYNSNIRITIMNYSFQSTRIIIVDRVAQEQIKEIHKTYNTTCISPRKQMAQITNGIPNSNPSPHMGKQRNMSNLQLLPLIQKSQIKSTMFYDPLREYKDSQQSSMKSLNLSQEQIHYTLRIRQQSTKDLEQQK